MRQIFDLAGWREAMADSMTQVMAEVVQFLPALIGALLVLLVGWGVSTLVAAFARRALRRFGFDRATEQMRVIESLRRAHVTSAPSAIVARLLWWMLMLTFLLTAVEMLGLRAVTTTIDRLIMYLPNVVAAVVIVVVGLLLGRFAQGLARSGAALTNLPQAHQLGSLVQAVVVLVTGVLALEQLGVATQILVTVFTVLVATLGLTLGVAFALGARPLVTHILAGHTLRQTLQPGKPVEVEGRQGVVERVGAVDTLFRDGNRMWSVGNAVLLESVIVR